MPGYIPRRFGIPVDLRKESLMTHSPRSVLTNVALSLFLSAIMVSWFWNNRFHLTLQLALLPPMLITCVLAVRALLRPPARQRDERWWVCLVCVLSVVYVYGYRFDPAKGLLLFGV